MGSQICFSYLYLVNSRMAELSRVNQCSCPGSSCAELRTWQCEGRQEGHGCLRDLAALVARSGEVGVLTAVGWPKLAQASQTQGPKAMFVILLESYCVTQSLLTSMGTEDLAGHCSGRSTTVHRLLTRQCCGENVLWAELTPRPLAEPRWFTPTHSIIGGFGCWVDGLRFYFKCNLAEKVPLPRDSDLFSTEPFGDTGPPLLKQLWWLHRHHSFFSGRNWGQSKFHNSCLLYFATIFPFSLSVTLIPPFPSTCA